MDEIGFVIKSLLFTCFAVFCLQVKMGETSIEQKITNALAKTATARWFKDMGRGAARATAAVSDKVAKSPVGQFAEKAAADFKKAPNPIGATQETLNQVNEIQNKQFQRLQDIENQ